MLKKFSFLPALVIALAILAGCGEKKDGTTTLPDNNKQQTTTNTTTTPPTTTTQTETKDTTTKKDTTATTDKDTKSEGGDMVKMETNMGTIKIKLYTDKTPVTAANFTKLVKSGFYNGIIFHRVIDGFMIQGGDPTGTGAGGSKEIIKDEFHPDLKHSKKGILSMANRGPNTGTSQFFILLAPQPHLDNKHTVFGEVVEGMDVVEKIGKTKTDGNDKPEKEVKMTKVTMVSK